MNIRFFKLLPLLFFILILLATCKKDSAKSERFILLTGTTWLSDSLLANGVDASGPGGVLEDFVGETKFNQDGTGTIGSLTGEWVFYDNETKIIISSDGLAVPVTVNIEELIQSSLKVTTSFRLPSSPTVLTAIKMTYKPK